MAASSEMERILAPLLSGAQIWDLDSQTTQALGAARALTLDDQVRLALLVAAKGASHESADMVLQPLLSGLLRKKLPFAPHQAAALLDAMNQWRFGGPLLPVLGVAARLELTPELRAALERLRGHSWLDSGYAEADKARARLEGILGHSEPKPAAKRGPWAAQVYSSVSGVDAEVPVRKLLGFGEKISGSKPAKKWRAEASALVELIGRDAFREFALGWLAIGPSPSTPPEPVEPAEADQQRALLWALTGYSDRQICAAVAVQHLKSPRHQLEVEHFSYKRILQRLIRQLPA